MKNLTLTTVLICACFVTSACAPRLGANHYSIHDAGRVNHTTRGVIVSARPINISATSTQMDNQPGTGAFLGAAGGGLLGSQVGKGRGSVLAGLAGAVAGGVAGHYAGQSLTDQQGFEYQVQLDNGSIISLAQGADPMFRIGQRVLVIRAENPQSGRGRIIADTTY